MLTAVGSRTPARLDRWSQARGRAQSERRRDPEGVNANLKPPSRALVRIDAIAQFEGHLLERMIREAAEEFEMTRQL